MKDVTPTRVVQLTGPGRGAVATLLVSGPTALELVSERFYSVTGRSRLSWSLNRLYFGTWRWDEVAEELVVCRTGECEFEIHCHGGRMAPQRIVDSLTTDGLAELVRPEDWLATQQTDCSIVTAQCLLAAAKTERTAAVLLDQTRGALRKRLLEIQTWINAQSTDQARTAIDRLIELSQLGLRIHRPYSVVLLGRPNAGKSSLINAIVGYQRSIVYDQPGTTRDLVRVQTVADGWLVELTDTAGVRTSDDEIERQGIRLVRSSLAQADLVLLIHDLTQSDRDVDFSPEEFDHTGSLRIGTKADAGDSSKRTITELDMVTSARTGQGIDRLIDLVADQIAPNPPVSGEAIPLLQSTTDVLLDISRHLSAGNLSEARGRVGILLEHEIHS